LLLLSAPPKIGISLNKLDDDRLLPHPLKFIIH